MTALIALGLAVLALMLSGIGVWAAVAWRHSRQRLDQLATDLYVDSRLEELTVQALSAMRQAVRRRADS